MRLPAKLRALIATIRFRDALIFQSPVIVALAIYLPEFSAANLARAAILSLGGFLLMAFIFAFNDWADVKLDERHPQKQIFPKDGITSNEMLALSGALALSGILLVAAVSLGHALIAAVGLMIGLAYSTPIRGTKGKGIPVFSSALHFGGTLLAFMFGSTAFAPIDTRALLIGAYFGLIISAGHLIQEVQDYSGDRLSHLRTNAVQFGPKSVFLASFGLFNLSFLCLFGLARARLMPQEAAYSALLFPVYVFLAVRAYRAGLDRENMRRFRGQYRILFAVILVLILTSVIIHKVLGG
jgi:4-hydroxybenzoate polyprenyltransferase